MARRGRFGRNPRPSQSLTSVILAAAREMAAAVDRAIRSAWANGGTYQGKPVSDEMLLDHLQGKLEGLSQDDPAYDLAKEEYQQASFQIDEDKVITRYEQGKIGEAAVAKFYLGWAKRSDVSKGSGFYRTLQKQAARFLQSAASKGRAGASKAKADAYNQYSAAVYERDIKLGDNLVAALTQWARENNIIGQNEGLDKMQLAGENDPGQMEAILRGVSNDPKMAEYIRTLDPNFNGQLTSAYVAAALKRGVDGYGLIAARAAADGYSDEAKKANTAAGKLADAGTDIASWPVAESYQVARDAFDRVWKNAAATDVDKSLAAESFAKKLDKLSGSSLLSPAQKNRLVDDASALRGDPQGGTHNSFYEDYLGRKTAGTEGSAASGENATFATEMGRISFWQQQYEANPGAYVYASYTVNAAGQQVYDPTGKGPVGVVPRSSVDSAPGLSHVVPVTTVSGEAILQAVRVVPIYADSPDGGEPVQVGQAMVYNSAGVPTTIYGMTRPDGTVDWTTVSPFSQRVNQTTKDDGIHLTIPAISTDPAADAAAIDAQFPGLNIGAAFADGARPGDGMSWTSEGAGPGKGASGTRNDVKITFKNGQFTVTQVASAVDATGNVTGKVDTGAQLWNLPPTGAQLIEAVWDQSRLTAGPNPRIDFATPSIAALVESKAHGDAAIAAWNSPQFQENLYNEQVALTGGDPAKLAAMAANDRRIAQGLAMYGADKSHGMYEFNADREDRRRAIGESRGETDTREQVRIKNAGEIRLPTFKNNAPAGAPWGSFNTPGFHAGEVGSPYAGPPTPASLQEMVYSPRGVPAPQPTPTPVVNPLGSRSVAPMSTPIPAPLPAPSATPNVSTSVGFILPTPNPGAAPNLHDQVDPITGRRMIGGR